MPIGPALPDHGAKPHITPGTSEPSSRAERESTAYETVALPLSYEGAVPRVIHGSRGLRGRISLPGYTG